MTNRLLPLLFLTSAALMASAAEDDRMAQAKRLEQLGRFPEAQSLYEEILTECDITGIGNPEAAVALNNIGAHYFSTAEYPSANAAYLQALHFTKRQLGEESEEYAVILSNLAALRRSTGKAAEALTYLETARKQLERIHGTDSVRLLAVWNNIAETRRSLLDLDGAEAAGRKALAIATAQGGLEDDRLARAQHTLAGVLQSRGNTSESIALYQSSLAVRTRLFGETHKQIATTLTSLAVALLEAGSVEEAEQAASRAVGIAEKVVPASHPLLGAAYSNLAQIYRREKRYLLAEPLYRKAVDIWAVNPGAGSAEYAQGLLNLGSYFYETGRIQSALVTYQRAVPAANAAFGPNHTVTEAAKAGLAETSRVVGRRSEGELLRVGRKN